MVSWEGLVLGIPRDVISLYFFFFFIEHPVANAGFMSIAQNYIKTHFRPNDLLDLSIFWGLGSFIFPTIKS